MAYPKEVQENIDFLNEYEENDALTKFHIFHLYPGKIAYPHGFYDSRFFMLIGFNTDKMQKRDLGEHDAITFAPNECPIADARVFADGSFFIKMSKEVQLDGMFQNIYIRLAK